MTTETNLMAEDMANLTRSAFLKKYSRQAMVDAALELNVDIDEDTSTKADMYDQLEEADWDPEPVVTEPGAIENPFRGKSSVSEPVNRTWDIADRMFQEARNNGLARPRRKDVVERCMARGITYYTARTQYQAWFSHTNKATLLVCDGNVVIPKVKKSK